MYICGVLNQEQNDRRGVAQPGSAPQWGCGGRGFKSLRPDQYIRSVSSSALLSSTKRIIQHQKEPEE